MSEFTDEDVIRYVLGEATPEAAAALRTRAAENKELAATVELLSFSGPASFATVSQPPRRRRYSPTGARRIALALVACLTVGGLSWAGWVVLSPRPLLEDNFNSGWGDPNKWRTPRRSVKSENGHLRLFDRGYLVTTEEFPGPLELQFRWRWTDLAGDFHYRDELTVALLSSGKPRDIDAFEATDGILVKFNATAGFITISESVDPVNKLANTNEGSTPWPAEQWHDVRITVDAETISVFVADSAGNHRKDPVVSARILRDFPRHHIAFYNRERLANASHESWIDDVLLRRLVPARR